MRACAVCFYFRGGWGDPEGDCWIDPPSVFLVHDQAGEATFTSIRPTVGAQEFCSRFSHRNGPKAGSPPATHQLAPEERETA